MHGIFPSFPAVVILQFAGPEEAQNPAGRLSVAPFQSRFRDVRVSTDLRQPVKAFCRMCEPSLRILVNGDSCHRLIETGFDISEYFRIIMARNYCKPFRVGVTSRAFCAQSRTTKVPIALKAELDIDWLD